MNVNNVRLPGEGVGWVGPLTVKLSARNEKLCQLIQRMDQADTKQDWLELAAEFSAIRAFALAQKCQNRAGGA